MPRTAIASDTAGSLSQYFAESGARVDKGETVGEIECMKCMFPIVAPCDGVLTWRAQLGEFVGQDQVIAEIET